MSTIVRLGYFVPGKLYNTAGIIVSYAEAQGIYTYLSLPSGSKLVFLSKKELTRYKDPKIGDCIIYDLYFLYKGQIVSVTSGWSNEFVRMDNLI